MGEVSRHVYFKTFSHCVVFTKFVLTAGASGYLLRHLFGMQPWNLLYLSRCTDVCRNASVRSKLVGDHHLGHVVGKWGAGGEFQPVLVGKEGSASREQRLASLVKSMIQIIIFPIPPTRAQVLPIGSCQAQAGRGHPRLDSIDPKVKLLITYILSPKLS
jgi:hypothetical protein